MRRNRFSVGFSLMSMLSASVAFAAAGPWKRHTIDNTSRGADGVRMADVNGDGRLDITTGWEEGGLIRVYLNPGHAKSKRPWPAVTVGKVKSPEDAVFVDLDGDGAVDVVSSCEGKTRTMYVHWAPKDKARYLDETAWRTEPIPATTDKQMWMFCLPMDVDGKNGIDLVVGSKGGGATVGWLESPGAPANPRDLKAWKFHPKYKAGWIMSLIAADMDGDGDDDVVISDRKGGNRGVHWLEMPARDAVTSPNPWKTHMVGWADKEVMFASVTSGRAPGLPRAVVAIKPNLIADTGWWFGGHAYPADRFGTAKAVRVAKMDDNEEHDVVISCEQATGGRSGVFMFRVAGKTETWVDISGPEGVKFDLIELLDLDGDGDLDVITCEEAANLGVIWYENPTK